MSKPSFMPFDIGFDHFHTIGETSFAIDAPVAFQLVSEWPAARLFHQNIVAAHECAAWVYIRLGEDGELISEAVQFVSMRPDMIESSTH